MSLTATPRVFPAAGAVAASVWKPAVLTAYCAILAVLAFHHEPWFDEAQAWLLARDASLPDLFLRYLRPEGTPGLWHLLLMAPAKLGCPYWTMHLLTAVLATAAAAMILWLSPFPLAIRIALPFSYFLLYQYAVVARSYVLVAPFLFANPWFLPQARSKPWILITFLILLANVSVQGTLAAVGILLAYWIEIWTDRESQKPALSPQLVAASGVLLVVVAIVAAEVWPVSRSPFFTKIIAASGFRDHVGRGASQIAEAFSFRLSVSFVPLALSLFWMARNRKALYFVLPAGLVLVFSSFVYASLWHAGILFLLWLFAMWITSARSLRPVPLYVWLAWVMVLGIHIYWAARAGVREIEVIYSGSRALAENIAPDVAAGKRIAGAGYMLAAVQPYFRKNVLINYHGGNAPAFWFYTRSNGLDIDPATLPLQNPDLIVVSLWKMPPAERDELIRSLADSGYPVIQEFPGKIIWKSVIMMDDSYLVARKKVNR